MNTENLKRHLTGMSVYPGPGFTLQMDMTLYILTRTDWRLKKKKKNASVES